MHPYLKQALILCNQVSIIRQKLKKAIQSIERVKAALPGIIVKQVFELDFITQNTRQREKQDNNRQINNKNNQKSN